MNGLNKAIEKLNLFDKDLKPVSVSEINDEYLFGVTRNGEITLGNNFYLISLKDDSIKSLNPIRDTDIFNKYKNNFKKIN